jgi:hypothetical protein
MKRAIATAAVAANLAACASTAALSVPESLAPGADQVLALTVPARGVQVYTCRARADGSGHEWAFVAPEAELLDASGRSIGTHGAGPVWQAADGSHVVGTVKARADAPAPGAIPWLLLATKSAGPEGAFSRVTRIQRVNTAGGAAPTDPCTEGLQGRVVRVPYTADYRLFTPR